MWFQDSANAVKIFIESIAPFCFAPHITMASVSQETLSCPLKNKKEDLNVVLQWALLSLVKSWLTEGKRQWVMETHVRGI